MPGGGAWNLRARKSRLRPAEPEALTARRKRRKRAGAVGACSVNAEDPRGVAVTRSVRKRPKEQGHLRKKNNVSKADEGSFCQ